MSGWSPKAKKKHECRKPNYLSICLHGGFAFGVDLKTSRIWTCGECNKSYRPYFTEYGYSGYVWKEVKTK